MAFAQDHLFLPSVAIGISLAVLAVAIVLPGFPSGRYAQDFTALLDGAYRLEHGQVPHRDFMVPFGGLVVVQTWIALKLEAFASPFGLLQISSWLLLLPASLALAVRQPSRPRAVALLLFVGWMALVPYVVEWEPIPEFNYNAVYNRTASAALFLLFVWIFGPKRARFDAVLVAWLLLLCLGWKISHFVVMLGVLGLAGLMSPIARRTGLGAAALLIAALVGLDLVTAGAVRAYGRDIAEMARINRGGGLYFLSALSIRTLPTLICGALAVIWLAGHPARPATVAWRRRVKHPVALLRAGRRPLWTATVILAVLATESQGTGNLALFPVIVLAFGPFASLAAGLAAPPERSRVDPVALALAAAVVVTAAYPLMETVLRRAGTMALRQAAFMRREPAIDPVIGRTLVARQTSETADRYAALWHGPESTEAIVRDAETAFTGGLNATEPAMSLAWARAVAAMGERVRRRALVGPSTRVTTIGYVEPFARLLGAEPVRGTRLWLDPWRTVGTLTVEQARAYLAEADAVFVQLCPPKQQLRDMIERSFRPALDPDFVRVEATACYELWLRQAR
ncbi:hypothetical protein [Methylobacterium sp. Leaf118]|uniref:hypothetical protein n=1 Tax=Methylobacterium sp. Leaf118 TaxID=2876562 RepID=UPI001E4C421E|nr:hypothetical protein [Methylobacterium sp. Leaf118]